MAETLSLANFPALNQLQVTQLNADAVAGALAITVQNATNFATNYAMIIGQLTAAKSELSIPSAINGLIATVPALTYDHKQFEPVTVLRGRQIKVYRAPNVDGTPPADTAFVQLAIVNIAVDNSVTPYTDASGGPNYWYKQTFLNPELALETDIAASSPVRGGDYGHFASIDDIRQVAGFVGNPDLTDQFIAMMRDSAEGEVKGAVSVAGYQLPFTTGRPIPAVLVNATLLLAAGYILSADYGVGAEGTNKEGKMKLQMGNDILEKVRSHAISLKDVLDADIQGTSFIKGWPDATTATADPEDAGGDKIFRITKVF